MKLTKPVHYSWEKFGKPYPPVVMPDLGATPRMLAPLFAARVPTWAAHLCYCCVSLPTTETSLGEAQACFAIPPYLVVPLRPPPSLQFPQNREALSITLPPSISL